MMNKELMEDSVCKLKSAISHVPEIIHRDLMSDFDTHDVISDVGCYSDHGGDVYEKRI